MRPGIRPTGRKTATIAIVDASTALTALQKSTREADTIRLGAAYADAPRLPLDIAVMEHTARGAVTPLNALRVLRESQKLTRVCFKVLMIDPAFRSRGLESLLIEALPDEGTMEWQKFEQALRGAGRTP